MTNLERDRRGFLLFNHFTCLLIALIYSHYLLSLRLQFSDNLFSFFLENMYFILLEWGMRWVMSSHLFEYKGLKRAKNVSLLLLLLFFQSSCSRWARRALLAPVSSDRARVCPCASVGKASWAVSSTLFKEEQACVHWKLCLPTVSYFCFCLPWI